MGVVTFTDEYASPIPPARAFKALILNGDNLIPKLMPQAFKSIELIQGDGGAGSIKQINFAEGGPFKFVKHRVDEVNEEAYKYNYTLIEGDVLMGKFEKICYEIELVASADGGSITKSTTKYYPLGNYVINEEELKAGMDKAGGMFKAVEDYLIQNPNAYA
ncbi:Major strawberry allergen Fra a 1.06 [Camellia lanceoleosa]|uniref:Major strawberry allergen Fra a 1.06 n=1 Tax=Camellia lanceoleosa TaxID=1840588 RepID=A0ACC0H7H0_9ERIC|nr:Major strawberry allergen Fra a 1.06 [Camellia lanceoleosa]